MESQTVSGSPSVVLACLPHKGMVRTCSSGCIHVTYGPITLDFHLPEYFQTLVETVGGREEPQERIYLRHGNALLTFSAEEFAEFAGLIRDAAVELDRLNVVRRLLSAGCRS